MARRGVGTTLYVAYAPLAVRGLQRSVDSWSGVEWDLKWVCGRWESGNDQAG